jgi:3-hydroxybutyryl-CoA dehydratase
LNPESWIGRRATRKVAMTTALIDRFAAISGDSSPLHMDASFARACGFRGRVAHGELLGALISGLIGTELPGARGVLQEIRLGFHNPCYEGDEITIEIQVSDHHVSVNAVSCEVRVRNREELLLVKGVFRSGLIA